MSGLEVVGLARSVKAYLAQARSAPTRFGAWTLVRDFPAWRRAQQGSALEAGDPWVTFGARRELERILTPSSRVFEYGSGGSTVFFARRAGQVVTVEHDSAWFERVEQVVARYQNAQLILAEPTPIPTGTSPIDAHRYASSDPQYRGSWFRDYARAIERFPEGYFDVVLVDGRARVASFIHGALSLKPGGAIVLDDSERLLYAEVSETVRGWSRQGYAGPKPFVPQFSETTIWRRPG